jgi:hypothetical protein
MKVTTHFHLMLRSRRHGFIHPYAHMASWHNEDQAHDIKVADRSYENVAHLKYSRITVTNQNLIQEEIKMRFNSGNACYYSVQNLLSSSLVSKL